jgi:hypothetical protein
MALVFQEGFDHFNGLAALTGGLDAAYNANPSGFVAGIFGGQAIRMSQADACMMPFGGTTNECTVTGYMRVVTNPSSATPGHMAVGSNEAGSQMGFRIFSDNSCRIGRGGSTTTAYVGNFGDPNTFKTGVWHHFAWEVVCHDTLGRTAFYVDGVKVIEAINVDTRQSATSDILSWCQIAATYSSGSGGGVVDYDHIMIYDTATRPAGQHRLETAAPSADGATLNWTPSTGTQHFAVVDGATVGIADFLSSSVLGDLDIVSYPALTAAPTEIAGVRHIAWLEKDEAQTREIFLGIGSGATVSDGASIPAPVQLGVKSRFDLVDPNSAAAWTEANLNAATTRLEISV